MGENFYQDLIADMKPGEFFWSGKFLVISHPLDDKGFASTQVLRIENKAVRRRLTAQLKAKGLTPHASGD